MFRRGLLRLAGIAAIVAVVVIALVVIKVGATPTAEAGGPHVPQVKGGPDVETQSSLFWD